MTGTNHTCPRCGSGNITTATALGGNMVAECRRCQHHWTQTAQWAPPS